MKFYTPLQRLSWYWRNHLWLQLFTLLIFLFIFETCRTSKSAQKDTEKAATQTEHKISHKRQEQPAPDTLKKKPAPKTAPTEVSIDSLLQQMSLREKIGQLFITAAYGTYESKDDPEFLHISKLIKQYHVGGLIFFSGHVYGQAIMTNRLQHISKIPLWITQDTEYGVAMRVDEATAITPAMGIAATGNIQNAYTAGRITGQEARDLGVHQIFAPVLDVNNNPDNPVINVRSYSSNPDTVARYGDAFIRGAIEEGVVPTGKHFPGHGDTGTDSHLSLPVIKKPYSEIDSVELVPFRDAVRNGIPAIMSGHIAFPRISSNPDLPATLDPNILHRILRDSLNFKGLVVTDGLDMRGITSKFSPGDAVVDALQAGADLVLLSPDALTAIDEVQRAVVQGKISEKQIDQSVRKILTWKKRMDLFKNAQVDPYALSSQINTRKNIVDADRIARESITVLKNKGDILPIRASDYPHIVAVSVADDESGTTGSYFGRLLKKYHPEVDFFVYDKRSSRKEKERIVRAARRADLLLIGSFIYVRSYKDIQLSPEQITFLHRLTDLPNPTGLIAFGNPYVIQDLPHTEMHMLAWSAGSRQIKAAVPALFGASEVNGHLPTEIPGYYRLGDGIHLPKSTVRMDLPESAGLSSDTLRQIDDVMHEAIRDSVFPGGVVGVMKDGVLTWKKGYGYQTYEKTEPIRGNAIYDLASLTKVLATTPAIMKLVDEGEIKLDDPVSKYLPEFGRHHQQKVTIRNLLLHNSGLPPYRVYVDKLKSRKEILDAVMKEPLQNKPGTEYEYSDLGFILLGAIVEQVTGRQLDRYMRRTFYYPMGMNSTYFNPKRLGGWITNRIPPTEIDTTYRHKTIQAEVQDERAWYMDGVAGHAGLFSSVRDISAFLDMLLQGGSYAGNSYLSPQTIDQFTSEQGRHSNRGFGFDRKSKGFSTAGTLTSSKTFGHLGFSGTSFWVDPKHNMAIILLTNRTYPYRSYGKKINQIRAKVADIAIKSIKK